MLGGQSQVRSLAVLLGDGEGPEGRLCPHTGLAHAAPSAVAPAPRGDGTRASGERAPARGVHRLGLLRQDSATLSGGCGFLLGAGPGEDAVPGGPERGFSTRQLFHERPWGGPDTLSTGMTAAGLCRKGGGRS